MGGLGGTGFSTESESASSSTDEIWLAVWSTVPARRELSLVLASSWKLAGETNDFDSSPELLEFEIREAIVVGISPAVRVSPLTVLE